MSKDLNLCQFIGRLGKDPELKFMPNGDAVCNISIACSDDYKDKNSGQKVEQTNWVNIVFFRGLAEVAGKYLTKGSQIYVSGKQRTRKWQAQDGSDRYSTEIVGDNMQMVGGKPEGASSAPQQQPQQYQQQAHPQGQPQGVHNAQQNNMDSFDSSDIPF